MSLFHELMVTELMESALNEDLRALEVSMEPAVRKGPKRDMLRQRQALW